MKYLILIYSNPQSRAIWEGMSNEQRGEGLDYYAGLNEALAASGELLASEALADPSRALRVSVRDGGAHTTDGPFAEVKEHLAGFFLVECGGVERAVEIAAKIPEAAFGLVEVRPVRQLSDLLR